jgi:hypothetical protein
MDWFYRSSARSILCLCRDPEKMRDDGFVSALHDDVHCMKGRAFLQRARVAPIDLAPLRPLVRHEEKRRIGMHAPIENGPPSTPWAVNPKTITGLVMVALGLILLVATVTDSQLVGQMMVLLLGVIFLTWGVMVRHPGPLIPGCILTGLGVGIVLSQWLFAGVSGEAQGGVITLCMGLGFLLIMPTQQVVARQGTHWWPWIPGGILSLTGLGLLLGEAGLTMLAWIGRLWPLGLIAVGGVLLYQALRSRRTAADDQPVTMSLPPDPTTEADATVSEKQDSDAHEPSGVS